MPFGTRPGAHVPFGTPPKDQTPKPDEKEHREAIPEGINLGEIAKLKQANAAMRSELQQLQQRLVGAGIALVDPSQYTLAELEEEIDGLAAKLREDPDDEDASDKLSNFIEARERHTDYIARKRKEQEDWRAEHLDEMEEAFRDLMERWKNWPPEQRQRKRASFPVLRLLELFDRDRDSDGASNESRRDAVSRLHPADFRQFSTKNLSRNDLLAVFFTMPVDAFATDHADVKANFREAVFKKLSSSSRTDAGGILATPRPRPTPQRVAKHPFGNLQSQGASLKEELARKLKLRQAQ